MQTSGMTRTVMGCRGTAALHPKLQCKVSLLRGQLRPDWVALQSFLDKRSVIVFNRGNAAIATLTTVPAVLAEMRMHDDYTLRC